MKKYNNLRNVELRGLRNQKSLRSPREILEGTVCFATKKKNTNLDFLKRDFFFFPFFKVSNSPDFVDAKPSCKTQMRELRQMVRNWT